MELILRSLKKELDVKIKIKENKPNLTAGGQYIVSNSQHLYFLHEYTHVESKAVQFEREGYKYVQVFSLSKPIYFTIHQQSRACLLCGTVALKFDFIKRTLIRICVLYNDNSTPETAPL